MRGTVVANVNSDIKKDPVKVEEAASTPKQQQYEKAPTDRINESRASFGGADQATVDKLEKEVDSLKEQVSRI